MMVQHMGARGGGENRDGYRRVKGCRPSGNWFRLSHHSGRRRGFCFRLLPNSEPLKQCGAQVLTRVSKGLAAKQI